MRYSFAALALALAVTGPATSALAQPEASLRMRVAARRDLEQAKVNLRYYWQVDYPRQCRELDAAIECTRAEIDNNYSLLREYRPFTRFSIGEPFPITVRNLQMCIQAGELRLNDLIDERNALIRFHSDQFRLLAADVYEARLRVAELEANLAQSKTATGELPAQQ
jgi:hypothetical protein